MTHTLDKAKVEEELHKRGWRRGRYGEWLIPDTCGWKNIEADWTASILAGIVCELEEKKKATKEFLRTHPTSKR